MNLQMRGLLCSGKPDYRQTQLETYVRTHEQHQMHTMPAIIDRKMHSMVRALGRSDAKPRAIGCATTKTN